MLDVNQLFFRSGVKVIDGYKNSAIYDLHQKRVFLVSKNVVSSILGCGSLYSIDDCLVKKMVDNAIVTEKNEDKELNPQKFEYDVFDDSNTYKRCTLLYVEVTDKCNFRCMHCYADMQPGGCRELSIKQFESIISNIKHGDACDIRLTGGEPFLHNKITELVDLVEKNVKPNITHSIVTNGSFKVEDALYAMERGFEIQVSIYGMNADTFKNFTNASEVYWERVQNNLECLSVSPFKDKVLLCFAVNKQSYTEIDDFKKFAEKYGFRYIFNRPASTGRAVDNWGKLELSEEKHYEFAKNTKASTLRYCYHLCQLHISVIGVNGDVFPCSFLRNKSWIMGNVFEDSFDDIWKNFRYKQFRALNPTKVEKCSKCEFIYMCSAGCCAEAVGVNGDILSVYPWCKLKPYEHDYLTVSENEMYIVDKLAAGTFEFIKV